MREPAHQKELDCHVFLSLPPFTPYLMEDEGKWLVAYPSMDGWEVERFDSKGAAYEFAGSCRAEQEDGN